jgi:hypothetical protein
MTAESLTKRLAKLRRHGERNRSAQQTVLGPV